MNITPYVPNQYMGEIQFYDSITKTYKFDENGKIIEAIPITKEYSYHISGAYTTHFGILRIGNNITEIGEFGIMLSKIGCYIKNDFFQVPRGNPKVSKVASSTECATLCYENSDCVLSWSYHVTTRRCIFNQGQNKTILKRDFYFVKEDFSTGWATGLKEC